MKEIQKMLDKHNNVHEDIKREELIEKCAKGGEALISLNGALATWTPPESTGRVPKDTYIVCHTESEENIDWDSPNNIPMDPETFDIIYEDALKTLSKKDTIFVTNRSIGADEEFALPVKTISNSALTALFSDNMFRKTSTKNSVFKDDCFNLLVVPRDKLNPEKYNGKLREFDKGITSNMAVAMDFDRKIGIIYGSQYCGSVKKLMFTVMNYLLPEKGVLPLHCSANEGKDGNTSLFLGLSGTGKTTLSADPTRALLGDDEHGWCDTGIFNFENGCYAKFIDINPRKEPEIYDAVMHKADYKEHGAILENAMMYPSRTFDFNDDRLTPNSRASYPLSFLKNIKKSSVGLHPKAILFLTADANGVLPPLSKLTTEQAMLWFLMGYTSKLAGTETGIVEPKTTFSRFFGQPFMPRNPDVYAKMFGERIEKHNSKVYLINTGWTGGPYGVGERIDINMTRRMVEAVLKKELVDIDYREDDLFHLHRPTKCPGVPNEILNPRNTWEDKFAYDERAANLAKEFSHHFDKAYRGKVDENLAKVCPGK